MTTLRRDNIPEIGLITAFRQHEDAADRGGERDACPGERAGGERDRDHVVAGCPHEVLDHLLVARLRQADDAHHEPRVRAGEDDAGGFDRDVGPRADRDADIGTRERRGVVHTVADHRDLQPAAL